MALSMGKGDVITLVAMLIGLGIAWGTTQQRISHLDEKVSEIHNSIVPKLEQVRDLARENSTRVTALERR